MVIDMAKGTKQKLKLIYLIKIMMEKTDDEHYITMPEIIEALDKYGVTAERKSIYADIEAIRELGIDIIGEQKGKTYYYHVGGRQFEIAELRLLVDVIQSAKFITAKKSNELIKKLESLASIHEARQLQRQVCVIGRTKTVNENIYYNVDEIHKAITSNMKIKFQYFQWNVKKEMELRKNGEFYEISPWALSWDDENYYMIGFDAEANIIKHYRVDKMLKIESLEEKREGKELFDTFDIAAYSRKSFGMYGGEEEFVRLQCDNSLAGVIVDRFGADVMMTAGDEESFYVNVHVAVSKPFLGWLFALGNKVKIISPAEVVDEMKNMIQNLYEMYC